MIPTEDVGNDVHDGVMDMNTTPDQLTLDTSAGPAAAYVATPASGSGPGVLVLHAWWGLNDDFRGWCDQLAAAGFVALAPDYRAGRVATTIEDANAMRADFGVEQTQPVVEAAHDELLRRSDGSAVGIVGASMGAAWAFHLAETRPDQVGAVVAYYGISDADWAAVQARVLHHFGDQDQMDPVSDAEAMQADLEKAGVDARLEVYAGADHWFAEASRPEHDPAAAELAWSRTLAHLRG
jgi:carboxymethylenebutenolidase